MKSLDVSGSCVVCSRESFAKINDCKTMEALVLIFDMNMLLIVFLKLAWSAVSLRE